MALVHTTPTRNALAAAVASAVDAGAGPGVVVLLTSADAVVAELEMSVPPFGAPADGSIEAGAIADDANTAAGTVSQFILADSTGAEVYRGTVTTVGGGGDMELSSLTFAAGDTASISSLIYTASA